MGLSQLQTSLGFLQKHNFWERQEIKVSSRDVHVTSSVYIEHPAQLT